MSTHIKEGVAAKKLKTYLSYLTRLRQAVAHPFLLEGVLRENFTLEDFSYLRRQLSAIYGQTAMHRQVQRWLTMEYEAREGQESSPATFGNSRFGYTFDMNDELSQIEASKSLAEVICRICYDVPVDPRITDVSAFVNCGVQTILTSSKCGHTFCKECLKEALKLKASCPTCKAMLWEIDALEQPEGMPAELSDDDTTGRKRRRRKNKKPEDWELGDDYNLAQPEMKDSHNWIKQYDEAYPQKELVASAKTIAVKNQILVWQQEAPEDKIIGRLLACSFPVSGFVHPSSLTHTKSLCQLVQAGLHHRPHAPR